MEYKTNGVFVTWKWLLTAQLGAVAAFIALMTLHNNAAERVEVRLQKQIDRVEQALDRIEGQHLEFANRRAPPPPQP